MNNTPSCVTVAGMVAGVDKYVNAFSIAMPSHAPLGNDQQPLKIRVIIYTIY